MTYLASFSFQLIVVVFVVVVCRKQIVSSIKVNKISHRNMICEWKHTNNSLAAESSLVKKCFFFLLGRVFNEILIISKIVILGKCRGYRLLHGAIGGRGKS